MKIEIETTEPVTKTIDVEFPYYYKHVLSGIPDDYTSIYYGKIFHRNKKFGGYFINESIQKDISGQEYNIEYEEKVNVLHFSDYFHEQHKSNKEEFEAARQRALDFLEGINNA